MIDDKRLAPVGSVRDRLSCGFNHCCAQKEIVNPRLAQLGQRLLRKRLDIAHVGQVQR